MNKIFIKPADGITAPLREHPIDRPLPAAGDWRPNNQFWLRRLRDKDVVEATPPAAKGGAAATDPVAELLAGDAKAVKAGVGELSTEALADALGREKAAATPRTQVINALQAEIDRRAASK